MVKTYLSAAIQNWISEKTKNNWWGFWRLKKIALHWQLSSVDKVGIWPEVTGPVFIQNSGRIEIGDRVILGSKWHKPISISLVKPEAKLTIEDDVFINYGVDIGLMNEICIGAKTLIGNECIIYDTDWHTLDGLEAEAPALPTRIGRGVWLGARVIVMKGVTIGDNTVVAANSTVTKDLPANVLAGGSPAKVIRPIERHRYAQPD
jgi:acetyltransferase-like isoleucine patch superfamily enzyme